LNVAQIVQLNLISSIGKHKHEPTHHVHHIHTHSIHS